MNLAYKWVAVALMLAEANYCANRIELADELPIERSGLRHIFVDDPRIDWFGGRLDDAKYSFSFFKGRLRFIHKLDAYAGLGEFEAFRRLADKPPMITTNQAYLIASNWLSCASVDVAALEKTNPPEPRQMTCWDQTQREHPVPFFEILWGPLDEKRASHRVEILIDGRTKELVHLRLEDESLSRRPKELVRNRKALLEITDEEFLAYSEEEKQNLVRRFSAAAGALPKENSGGTTNNSPATPPTPARPQP